MRPLHPTTSLLLLLFLFLWAGLGLGIVFAALNKGELLLATVAVLCAWQLRMPRHVAATLGTISGILLLQTCWLLPALDVRALALLAGPPRRPISCTALTSAWRLSNG